MRFFGVLLLSFTAFFVAAQQARNIVLRQKLYSDCAAFWSEFTNYLAYTRASPKDILLRLSRFRQYGRLDFVAATVEKQKELPFAQAYAEALEQSVLSGSEIEELLYAIGRIPGSSNLENQLEKMQLICRQLHAIVDEQQKEALEKTKLWQGMSYLSAAFVFIILI